MAVHIFDHFDPLIPLQKHVRTCTKGPIYGRIFESGMVRLELYRPSFYQEEFSSFGLFTCWSMGEGVLTICSQRRE